MDALTQQEAFRLIGAIKGVPLVCLVILKMNGLPMGVKRVAAISGYSYNTVNKGLLTLEEYGLVIQTRRFDGWQLTNKGRQLMLLGIETERSLSESQNLRLDSSSSKTLLIDSGTCMSTHEQQLQLPIESQNLRLDLPDPAFGRLTDLLIKRCGTAPSKAQEAIKQALTAGDEPATLISDILIWLAYCQSEQGKGSKPATLIPARIKEGIPPPEFYDPPLAVEQEIQRLQAELS